MGVMVGVGDKSTDNRLNCGVGCGCDEDGTAVGEPRETTAACGVGEDDDGDD